MEKEILGILVEVLLDEKLDDIMMQDQRYVELQNQINEQGEKFEKINMGEEERHVVNDLISLHIACIDFYVKSAYKQGFKDCLSLLQEIGLIGRQDQYDNDRKSGKP